jgi:isoquinoline 1-oxidoreductase beta subunit
MTASQAPGTDAAQVARVTGLRPEQVRIVVQMAGGSFGRRASPASDFVVESVQVARALVAAGRRAPVKVVWSREDDMRAGYYRPMAVHRAEIGLDETGRVVAWDHRIVAQRIVAGPSQESDLARDGVDASAFDGMREPYALPMRLTVHHPKVNVPVLWWRAVGSTHTAFVMETLIDEIAAAAQRDPVEYRLALTADNPRATRYRAALRLAVERSGYGRRTLPAGTAWGVAVHESFDSVVAYVVEARLAGQGASARPMLARVTAGVHCNAVVNPSGVEAQVQGSVLMALATTLPGHEITLKDGEVVQGNFDRFVLPRITDMPQVSVHVVPSTDPPTGMGEPALPPLAPAYANALSRLTGRRIRALPFPSA